MNRHIMDEMLHDATTHEALRRLAFLSAVVATIMVLYGILDHTAF